MWLRARRHGLVAVWLAAGGPAVAAEDLVIGQVAPLSGVIAGTRDHDVGGFKIGFGPQQRVGSRFVDVTVIGRDGRLLK